MVWPKRGVYFFFEPGERRQESGDGLRVVRVGTHALTKEPGTRLWTRLRQHKGPEKTGVGNHRGSIFRLILGTALIARNNCEFPTWAIKKLSKGVSRLSEQSLEREVTEVITNMPFLWLAVGDSAGPMSLRGYIERNSIALLSNYHRTQLDTSSSTWLGRLCDRERVRNSGLWNSEHVDERHSPKFLDVLDRLVLEVDKP